MSSQRPATALRRGGPTLLLALIALALPSGTAARSRIGFWAGEEFRGANWSGASTYWAPRETRRYTPAVWRVLSRNRIPLYLNLRYERDFGPLPPGEPRRREALAIIRHANRVGVPVWGWVLIPYTDGYWAWEGAAREEFSGVRSLVRWKRRHRLRLAGIALDPEQPLQMPFSEQSAILSGAGASDPGARLDPPGQCQAWRSYEEIADWARRHRQRLGAAPLAPALDDLDDGRLALQDALDFIVPAAPWRGLWFQAYRTSLAHIFGRDPGPGIVSSYLRSARRYFGPVASVSLGVAGGAGYGHLSQLAHDVRLAVTMGARQIPIYSLERTLSAYGGPDAIARLAWAARHPFHGRRAARARAPRPRAEKIRARIRAADALARSQTAAARGGSGVANSWPSGCG